MRLPHYLTWSREAPILNIDLGDREIPITCPDREPDGTVKDGPLAGMDPAIISLIYDDYPDTEEGEYEYYADVFGSKYKPVSQKVRPPPGVVTAKDAVVRQFPENPLDSLTPLPTHPPDFTPTAKLTTERLATIKINDGFLWPEEEKLFQYIFQLNERALAFDETHRGLFRSDYFTPYKIVTIDHIPWMQKNIPIAKGIYEDVIGIIKNRLNAGVYERAQSSYRSRYFCVKKKNGSLRLVHDLQPLNKVTIRDAGVPPIIDEFVEPFAGHQCYTVLDLFWAFDARQLDPVCRHMTAFQTPLGLLQLTTIPMGFTNSPSEFQACMTFILQDEIPNTANVFIDDLPIKGPRTQYLDSNGQPEVLAENPGIRRFIWEHALDVHRIMHRLAHAGLTFSAVKAQVARPEVLIVGQKCTGDGRVPDDDRVAKIIKWPVPTNVKQVRGFIGLCGTVRIWVENFSEKMRPLRLLTLKDAPFEWTELQQSTFDHMKELIASAPALCPIDYKCDRPVILAVDSSKFGIGFILYQIDEQGRRRPARYGSLPVSAVESNYSQAKLELFGLYRALRHWRIYLIGIRNLIVEVDAKYIKDMLNNPDLQPNATLNRWIQGVLLFDFTLVHVPAAQHKGPDALSRRPFTEEEMFEVDDDEEWFDNLALYVGISPSNAQRHWKSLAPRQELENKSTVFAASTSQDKTLQQVFHFLDTLELPTFTSPGKRYRFLRKCQNHFIKDGHMYRRLPHRMPVRIIFSETERQQILEEAHDKLAHKGEKATFEIISLRFFWPFYRSDVRKYVTSCLECRRRSIKKVEVPLTISTPISMFVKVYLDVMHMHSAKGFGAIVACRDDLSGVCEARALRNASSKEIARFFWEQIICRYGAVQHVITDNGPETKGAFEILVEKYNIHHIRISPYNSKANGVVERGHFILREALIKSCEGQINRWPDLLPLAVFADRITIRRSTGFSPYYLLHGTHPVLPMDLRESTFLVQGFQSNMSSEDLLALRIRQLQKKPEDIARAAEVLRQTRMNSKQHFEHKFAHRLRKEAFQPGDLVLVRNTAIERELNRKHKPRYLGPYEVVRQTHNGAYVVKELNGNISRESIAAFRLLSYDPSGRNLEDLTTDPITALGDVRHEEPTNEAELDELLGNEDEEDNTNSSDSEEDDNMPIGLRTRSRGRSQ